ncbi:hypothetical protein V7182_05315 [Neobacillus drentensis]|uniref:hypothetical protein n=1 Tax=Neobacillus drentensis TaxID=220684 RepID=UPI002FFF0E17
MFEETSLVIVLLVASLLVNLITLVIVIVLFKKNGMGADRKEGRGGSAQVKAAASTAPVSGIVFCRACGNQYDSISPACPSCKTAR